MNTQSSPLPLNTPPNKPTDKPVDSAGTPNRKNLLLVIACVVYGTLLLLPANILPIQGLDPIQHRLFALLFFAAILWFTEAIPGFATGVVVIACLILSISNASPSFFRRTLDYDSLLRYQDILRTLGDNTVFLMIGAFFIGATFKKYYLEQYIAYPLIAVSNILRGSPRFTLLFVMGTTATLSSFMSNSVATILMFSILTPLFTVLSTHHRTTEIFAISIPISASIGGLVLPFSTLANFRAADFIEDNFAIANDTFTWTRFSLPLAILLLLAGWVIMNLFLKKEVSKISFQPTNPGPMNRKQILATVIYFFTLILLIFNFQLGMRAPAVTILTAALYVFFRLVDADDIRSMNWDIVWLIASGVALGNALDRSGLALAIVQSLPLQTMGTYGVLAILLIVVIVFTTFMNNTSTANLLIPIAAATASSLPTLATIGSGRMFVQLVGITASIAFILPISTPPNAIAYSYKLFNAKTLIKVGLLLCAVSIIIILLLTSLYDGIGYFGQ